MHPQCTFQRHCDNKFLGGYFYRRYWGLTEVPRDIPAQAVYVYLENNAITSVPAGVFSHLFQCRRLYLHNNFIASLHKGSFTGLIKLETLELQHNALLNIREGPFHPLHALTALYINNNNISIIEAGAFDSLYSLTELCLFNNSLTALTPDLLINMPRPLELKLSHYSSRETDTNTWNCQSLCWLKHEEYFGTITLSSYRPRCVDIGAWSTLECGESGEFFSFCSE